MLQLESMLDILRREAEGYKALLQLSRKKNEAIVKNDVEKITEIGQREEAQLSVLAQIEKEREKERKALAGALSVPAQEVTLTRLSGHASSKQQIQISALRSELGQTIEEQVKLNDLNRMLIDTQLSYINFYLDVATRTDTFSNNYTSDGQVEQRKRSSMGLFDQQA